MQEFTILFAFAFLFLIIFLFIRLSIRLRKSGGTMTTIVHGSLDSFYDKDKKKAASMVVEQQAQKKMDEQASGKTR
jgi:hypothetical protein